MSLCREILRRIADSPMLNGAEEPSVEGRSADEITYQTHIMVQAGLIEALADGFIGSGISYGSLRLTWEGNDFLDAARDDTVWNTARARIAKAGGSFTFDLLLAMCKAVIKEKTGLDL